MHREKRLNRLDFRDSCNPNSVELSYRLQQTQRSDFGSRKPRNGDGYSKLESPQRHSSENNANHRDTKILSI